MGPKFKMLGLGLLAVLAAGAALVVNASATAGGHFGSNKGKTTINIVEQPDQHTIELYALGSAIYCNEAKYDGVAIGMKFASATLTPEYNGCETTNKEEVDIDTHDCTFQFTVHPEPETKHSTVHLTCPAGKKITISHPICTIEVAPQTVTGVVYTKTQWEGTEALTADLTVKDIAYTAHGFCQVLGTNRNDGEIKGAAIVKAWNADNPKEGANITVTGP